jgi:hypothetical protein
MPNATNGSCVSIAGQPRKYSEPELLFWEMVLHQTVRPEWRLVVAC